MDIHHRQPRGTLREEGSPLISKRDKDYCDGPIAPVEHAHRKSSPTKPTFSKSPRLFSVRVMLFLAILWLVLIHYFERTRYKSATGACKWNNWESWTGDQSSVIPHRVAFIADPQLVDDHTYPSMPRALNYLVRRMSDSYHSVNYQRLQADLDPDTTIFIGDLFDGGRDWDDGPWLEEYRRFCRIFPENKDRRSYRGLPGNHDIGFQNVSPSIAKRFASYFGEPNQAFVLGNHTFVQLDTISLSHEDPEVNSDANQFYEHAKALLDPLLPRILLTHVPLYRDPRVETCGSGRESKKPFPLMRGVEYQTAIEYSVSQDILKSLNPILVFSGDDHDYCDMTHIDYADNTKLLAREISCKTNSMTNGIKRPAVQLLSLNNPQDGTGAIERTYETTMCYLPNPYLSVKVYFAGLVATFSLLYAWFFRPHQIHQLSGGFLTPGSINIVSEKKAAAFFLHCIVVVLVVMLFLFLYTRI